MEENQTDWRRSEVKKNILAESEFSLLPQINNPDMRVQILKDFVKQNFPSNQLLDYALDVEKITTSKVRLISSSCLSQLLLKSTHSIFK